MTYTIKIRETLLDLSVPKVMGVVNINSDSFYAESRALNEKQLLQKVDKHMKEGADIIDIGAMSSRPGAVLSNPNDEAKMIQWALEQIGKNFKCHISVDTVHS
ncbi:MAG TPA: dihydropteroate synthase, partial [Saprospiraceae bacterium]|nr:dihydropteroate synthase [Saprospiraceae bacterium]